MKRYWQLWNDERKDLRAWMNGFSGSCKQPGLWAVLDVLWLAFWISAPTIQVRFSLAAKFHSIVLYEEKTKINKKETRNDTSLKKIATRVLE